MNKPTADTRYFCTYFDSNYLARGLTLYQSLIRHSQPFRLWVLCFDDLVFKTLQELALSGIHPISLSDFEAGDSALIQAKANRSKVEYYFTCTPFLPLYIFKNNPEVNLITYLDADLFFFSSLDPIYEELGENSILIIGHRFPPRLKYLEMEVGIYNVSFLSFRRDEEGLKCLKWWRAKCLEWCYDRVEGGRYADQKYLDEWSARFRKVVVLQHKGAGFAPWNTENHHIHYDADRSLLDGEPLIFFHFHRLKRITSWFYVLNSALYGGRAGTDLKKYLYQPYVKELRWATRFLSRAGFKVTTGSIRENSVSPFQKIDSFLRNTKSRQDNFLHRVDRSRQLFRRRLKNHDFFIILFNKFYW